MRFTSVIASLVIVTAVTAAAAGKRSGLDESGQKCLTDKAANTFIQNYIKLLSLPSNNTAGTAAAASVVANPDFKYISDSINFLANQTLGTVSVPNLHAFENQAHDSNQPGVYHIRTLNIWHTCHDIIWRWRYILVPGALPVQGINVYVLGADGKADILYSEFDSAIWAKDIGFTITPPAGGVPGKL